MRILIIEDERTIADALAEVLKRNSFLTDVSYDGAEGLEYALTGLFDLLIVDLMLPKLSGLEVIKKARNAGVNSKIIILSAKSDEETKVIGLTIGADDYVTKPFSIAELLARVKASFRRQAEQYRESLEFGDLIFDLGRNTLSCNGNSILLKSKEAALMQELLKTKDIIISKELLYDKVWGFDYDNDYNAIEVYVSFLRKKIKHINSKVQINVTRGNGYSLGYKHD